MDLMRSHFARLSLVLFVTMLLIPAAVRSVAPARALENRAPTNYGEDYTFAEESWVHFPAPGLLENDIDPDGDPLAVADVILSGPGLMEVSVNPDGSFDIHTFANTADGFDVFTYSITDGSHVSNYAPVNVTIQHYARNPVAEDDAFTAVEDTPLTIAPADLLANDYDPEGEPLNVHVSSNFGPAHGTVTGPNDGPYVYTPNPNYVGTDSFLYGAYSGFREDAATVTITITPTNDPPEALDDAFTTPQGTLLSIAAPGVIANDVDPDGDALTVELTGNPSHGSLNLAADGSLSYTPDPVFHGKDAVTYRAVDPSGEEAFATITITITAGNNAAFAPEDVDQDGTPAVTLTAEDIGAPSESNPFVPAINSRQGTSTPHANSRHRGDHTDS